MKKLMITFFIVVSVMINLKGQVTKIGGGLGLSSGFPFHEQTASPSFYFFFPHITKTASDRTSVTSMMFDINFQYVLNRLDRFEIYGLAGPDFLVAWKIDKFEGSVTNKEKDRLFGINLGIGTHAKVTDLLYVYGEAKYLYNNKYNQFMLSAGVLLNIDWMKKHQNADLN
jgi:hypothetical protein